MLKIAILGLGDRGMNYGTLALAGTDAQITAVCDKDPERVRLAAEKFHLTKEQTFLGSEAFFLAAEKGLKVVVCHVLRYSLFYQKINQLIKDGSIGRPVLIRHSENIGYWHYIHSYVRGHWHREEETSPMLMAKCCHDMDLLYWWTNSRFASIYSQGDLTFYNCILKLFELDAALGIW